MLILSMYKINKEKKIIMLIMFWDSLYVNPYIDVLILKIFFCPNEFGLFTDNDIGNLLNFLE